MIRIQGLRVTNLFGSFGLDSIFVSLGLVYLAVYSLLLVSYLWTNSYLWLIDTSAVLVFALITLFLTTRVVKRPGDSRFAIESIVRRDYSGWGLIAVAVALFISGRALIAIGTYVEQPHTTITPLSNLLLVGSFFSFIIGMLIIPWANKKSKSLFSLVDLAIIAISSGLLLWIVFRGPHTGVDANNALTIPTVATQIIVVSILILVFLWIVLRRVHQMLWPILLILAMATIATTASLFGYLAFVVPGAGTTIDPAYRLFVNASSSLAFLMISFAAISRLRIRDEQLHFNQQIPTVGEPVRLWQLLLPYPILFTLVFVRNLSEFTDFSINYRLEVGIAFTIVLTLMIIRQAQLIYRNQSLLTRASEAAIRDGLTGLYNHGTVQQLLVTLVDDARRQGSSLAVVFIDIDHFKHFNDTHGHQTGDRLLERIADLLRSRVRRDDFVGRYGGEEFVILLPNVSEDEAVTFADRLRMSVSKERFNVDFSTVGVTVSAGVAIYPDHAESASELIEAADQTMYKAKAGGRNQTVVCRPIPVRSTASVSAPAVDTSVQIGTSSKRLNTT